MFSIRELFLRSHEASKTPFYRRRPTALEQQTLFRPPEMAMSKRSLLPPLRACTDLPKSVPSMKAFPRIRFHRTPSLSTTLILMDIST